MNNIVTISGRLGVDLEWSHDTKDKKFYAGTIHNTRESGVVDIIPILMNEQTAQLITLTSVNKDEIDVNITGEFRSHNKIIDGRSKLLLYIFVRTIHVVGEVSDCNQINLTGFICKTPKYRTTPNNRIICDLLLAVNRNYNKSDYIPCIAWGNTAKYLSDQPIGAEISIVGRIQSREYTKKIGEVSETRVAYEVSISDIIANNQMETLESDLSIDDLFSSDIFDDLEV